jgi:acetyltransferase-like isoleucine patch superfamily enzyme
VVVKLIPDFAIAAGNPARVIKQRTITAPAADPAIMGRTGRSEDC